MGGKGVKLKNRAGSNPRLLRYKVKVKNSKVQPHNIEQNFSQINVCKVDGTVVKLNR